MTKMTNYLPKIKNIFSLGLLLLLILFTIIPLARGDSPVKPVEIDKNISQKTEEIISSFAKATQDKEKIKQEIGEKVEILIEKNIEEVENIEKNIVEDAQDTKILENLEELQISEKKIIREIKKIEKYTDQKSSFAKATEDNREAQKKIVLLEKKIERREEKIVIQTKKQLENLEEINEIFEEKFEENLEEIFVESVKTENASTPLSNQSEQEKIEIVQEAKKIVEVIKEERILEAPIFFALQDTTSSLPEPIATKQSHEMTDPKFSEQQSLEFILGENSWQEIFTAIFVPQKEKIIAIIDTGIDTNHEDLQGNFWTSENCFDENGEKISGGCLNGGWDFIDNDDNPYDIKYSHGTAVAGIIGAQSNNQKGIFSVNTGNTKIMALRACCSLEGYFEAQTIAKSIRFAVNNGADIINMSFGGPTHSQSIEDALGYAAEKNVLVVTAAGNYGNNNDVIPIYPANLNQKFKNITVVAALNETGELAKFSNYGEKTVDIAAPGVIVLTTVPGNSYKRFTGTSFATPFVSAMIEEGE